MKELYMTPEVEIVRFAPAMAIAEDGDIVSNPDDFPLEGGGADF